MADYITLRDGAHLYYESHGDGPPIVFAHGFSLDRRQWAPQVDALKDRFRCIVYDLRGFGHSSLPEGPYDHVEDLRELMDQLALARPHLVGLSLGGLVAHVFAARYPERLGSLTLVSAGSRDHEWTETRPVVDAFNFYARTQDVDETKAYWRGLPLFASLADYPEADAGIALMLAEYSGWHFKGADTQAPFPTDPGPRDIRVPTLVVRGARDMKGYFDISAELAERIPGGQLVTYDDCGHMLSMEETERFTGDLADFIDAVSSTHREET